LLPPRAVDVSAGGAANQEPFFSVGLNIRDLEVPPVKEELFQKICSVQDFCAGDRSEKSYSEDRTRGRRAIWNYSAV